MRYAMETSQGDQAHEDTEHRDRCAALAVGLASGAAAQQPGNTSNNRDNQQSRNTNVTVTGCLQSATSGLAGGAAPGAAASSTSRSSVDHFTLTNAKMGSGAGGATGRSAAAGATSLPSGSSYMLEGKTSDLSEHVNQQVEITGRFDSGGSSTSPARTGSTSSTSGSTRSGSSGRTDTAQRFRLNVRRRRWCQQAQHVRHWPAAACGIGSKDRFVLFAVSHARH